MSEIISKVARSKKEYKSLRTTVPSEISFYLGLEDGDSIVWEKKEVEGKKVIAVRKQ
ncbi:MAG: hypothetical protein KO464_07925 [Candidatus Methanofastidiosum sp.]|nr:hypothetical protein [Methanofastidiosum sp.]